jgi:hypothetical protein
VNIDGVVAVVVGVKIVRVKIVGVKIVSVKVVGVKLVSVKSVSEKVIGVKMVKVVVVVVVVVVDINDDDDRGLARVHVAPRPLFPLVVSCIHFFQPNVFLDPPLFALFIYVQCDQNRFLEKRPKCFQSRPILKLIRKNFA